jgi:hypothetical protein
MTLQDQRLHPHFSRLPGDVNGVTAPLNPGVGGEMDVNVDRPFDQSVCVAH